LEKQKWKNRTGEIGIAKRETEKEGAGNERRAKKNGNRKGR
jgi:hypothetical protein